MALINDGTPAAVTGVCARLLPFRFRLILVTAAALAILLPQGKATAFEKDESVGEITAELLGSYTGDFDGMLERRRIRVLTSFSKTFYFLDRARQRGMTYELMKQFEKTLNEKYETKHRKITVVFVPVARDRLIPALIEGRGDIAAANLTITPERKALVEFSDPLYWGVKELIVTAPGTAKPKSIDDLSGQIVHVRKSSSYYASLAALNERFAAEGKAPIELVLTEEVLEDEDLLEMVNADLIPMVVVDSHKAHFWAKVLDEIAVHDEVAIREGGEIAWAFRKGSPALATEINAFVKKNKKRTLIGNMLFNRYLKSTKYVRNSHSKEALAKFKTTLEFFRKYAAQYDFDQLVLAAVGYQESTLDQSKRSSAGAVGVMQVLPSTAADPNVGIPDIHELEQNIHAGTKYLHFLHHRYFEDPEIPEVDQWLLTFAAYNAGPARVRGLREDARKMGLDPNRWFRNVEIAAAKEIGSETVKYVSNIFKYYIAYKLYAEDLRLEEQADD